MSLHDLIWFDWNMRMAGMHWLAMHPLALVPIALLLIFIWWGQRR